VRERLRASLDRVEVLGVGADLDAVEDRCPAGGDVERRNLLGRVDRVHLDASGEVAEKVKRVNVDERNGARRATARRWSVCGEGSETERESQTDAQLDDDKVVVARRARALGLPAVAHVLAGKDGRNMSIRSVSVVVSSRFCDAPSAGKQEVGADAVVLVALVDAAASIEGVRKVALAGHVRMFRRLAGVPGVRRVKDGADGAVRPEAGDTAVGDHAQPEVGEGLCRRRDREEVPRRRAKRHDR